MIWLDKNVEKRYYLCYSWDQSIKNWKQILLLQFLLSPSYHKSNFNYVMILLKIKILRIKWFYTIIRYNEIKHSTYIIGSADRYRRSNRRKSRILSSNEKVWLARRGNGEQNLWQEFVLLRGIAGLSRTRGVAQFSETWKSRSNFMKCGASLTVLRASGIRSSLLISLSFHDSTPKNDSHRLKQFIFDTVEICRRI